MTSRYRRGLAASHAANTSWSIKWGVKQEDGSVKRWRCHINASLQRQGTPAEHQAAREEALVAARAKAKALTQDPSVVWVTVYPPLTVALFGLGKRKDDHYRLAPVSRWTRSKGWTQEETY